jgi:hypothetical protein
VGQVTVRERIGHKVNVGDADEEALALLRRASIPTGSDRG